MNRMTEGWFSKSIIDRLCPQPEPTNGRKKICQLFILGVLLLCIFPLVATSQPITEHAGQVQLEVFGKVVNSHQQGVSDVTVTLLTASDPQEMDGKTPPLQQQIEIISESDGTYQGRLWVKKDLVGADTLLEITAYKPGFAEKSILVPSSDRFENGSTFIANVDLQIERKIGPGFWVASAVFVLAYILISFELLHRTMAAMLGASVMLVISYTIGTINPEYHLLSYESAIRAIDMNVIFLLMGMMIIVGILKHTGIFQWCAFKCYQLARGNVLLLAIILMSFTAVASAFLDNVTTMLLLTPVTIDIALSLRISPLSLLIPEILASNIGGTATLIGDPPNIMIGSFAGLTFLDFAENLGPVCIVVIVLLFIYTKVISGKEYKKGKVEDIQKFIDNLRQEYRITDTSLLGFGLFVMGIVVLLFLTHGIWHMEVSIAALFGASLLFTFGLLTRRVDVLEVIEKDIEWTTLLFFMFLFILVGGVEEAGLLDIVADGVLTLSQGNLVISICLVLWVSAIMSAFVDNIPFTATMLPIVAYLTQVIPGAENGVLWWALAFGACFGGNGTMIGASANVVTLGISESAGHSIGFVAFMKLAFPFMLVSVAVANVWLLLVY